MILDSSMFISNSKPPCAEKCFNTKMTWPVLNFRPATKFRLVITFPDIVSLLSFTITTTAIMCKLHVTRLSGRKNTNLRNFFV